MISILTQALLLTAAINPDAEWFVSTETDPVFWAGTLSNGAAVDGNIDFHLRQVPGLRFGVLGYSGTFSGDFAKSAVLTSDFKEVGWAVQWNGAGVEAQYQLHLGLARGGLQGGLRVQWNQFRFRLDGTERGVANQLALTPQVGFQWFPFSSLGLYLLPWAGVQLPVAGTDRLDVAGMTRATRRPLPVVTVHLGWEF